jgi:hypothetical protein
MTLALQELPDGSVRGTISFYPIAENPNVPSGRFSVSGARDGNMLMIEPDSWINQPPGYTMVAMEGTIRSGGNVYSGNMLDPGCGTFRLERQGSNGRN